ncbi:MAG: flagellar motor protein MotB [Desulfocurvibacter africanus]
MAKHLDETPTVPPRRTQEEAPEEGAPGWMTTFADMMSLLLCFFILLLSFSSMDVAKYEKVLGSLKYAFGVQRTPSDSEFASPPGVSQELSENLSADQKDILGLVLVLRKLVHQDVDVKDLAVVSSDRNGALLRVQAGAMFDPGSAALKPEAVKIIDKAVTILKERNFSVVIRGHTDSHIVHSAQFPSNWELSAARAAASARLVIERGAIDTNRIKAIGYADSRPLVPNSTEENRAFNRRVEFYFHKPNAEGVW